MSQTLESRLQVALVMVATLISIWVLGVPGAEAAETPIAINTTVVDFGQVLPGDTSLPISVTLVNTGGSPFGPINIFGGAPPTPEFNASQNCQAQTLQPAESCSVTYTFTPSGPGVFTDMSTFTISDTASAADGESFSVTLSGIGIDRLSATPLSHDFGWVALGETSPAMTTVITNLTGQPFGPINIFGGAPPTPEFNASQNCQAQTLQPAESCSVTYTFTPSGLGVFTDMSNFTISDTASAADGVAFEVNLAGEGVTAAEAAGHTVGLVDPAQGWWHLRNGAGQVTSFVYGNPGDYPIMGDWDCDGIDTPGMYRQSDGFVYLRNSNTQGIADIRFFFGNPGDLPIVGDFNGDGCDTVGIYRPSEGRFYIINKLGANEGGLGAAEVDYLFGNPGDKPFVGDFDGDDIDTIGLHRESTGFVYFRNSHTQGVADNEFFFGDPGDRLVAGDWGFVDGVDTPAVFRPSDTTFYFRHTNSQGVADSSLVFGQPSWLPVAGAFGLD